MIEEILRLAAEGFRLFPVIPRDKKPLLQDWPHCATTSEEQLKTWAEEFPSCNWAVATGRESGVFVLDFDGEAGRAAFVSLVEQYGDEFAQTRSVKTPRGGHLWFRYPEGDVEIRNSTGRLAPGLDVRAQGGFVLVPSSIHPSGERYTWIESPSTPLANAPSFLIARAAQTKAGGPTSAGSKANGNGHGQKIPRGQRNAVLASLAGSMRRRGMDLDAVFAALLAHDTQHCEPPLGQAEVRQIAESVCRYQPTDEPVIAKSIEATARPDMPDTVLDGRLGEIYQRRMNGAALAYAWGPLLTIAGASIFLKYQGQSLRGNLYWCSVGGVGTGKTASFERALHVLGIEPRDPVLLQAKYGSAEGLVNDLKDAGSCVRLLAPDELAHLLRKCAIEHSSFPTFLTTAFYQDQQKGGTKKDAWEINCRLSILGGVVEDDFGDCFGMASVSGLYDRFLFGLCPRPYEYEYYPLTGEPASITVSPPQVNGDVWEVRNEWRKAGIAGRVAENCLRVAYICAAIDRRRELRGADLGPHLALAKYQMKVREVLKPNPGKNPDAQCAISILDWLREHAPKGEWVRRRDLGRGINSHRCGPGVFNRSLLNMQFNDDLELDMKQKMVRLLLMTDDDSLGLVS